MPRDRCSSCRQPGIRPALVPVISAIPTTRSRRLRATWWSRRSPGHPQGTLGIQQQRLLRPRRPALRVADGRGSTRLHRPLSRNPLACCRRQPLVAGGLLQPQAIPFRSTSSAIPAAARQNEPQRVPLRCERTSSGCPKPHRGEELKGLGWSAPDVARYIELWNAASAGSDEPSGRTVSSCAKPRRRCPHSQRTWLHQEVDQGQDVLPLAALPLRRHAPG